MDRTFALLNTRHPICRPSNSHAACRHDRGIRIGPDLLTVIRTHPRLRRSPRSISPKWSSSPQMSTQSRKTVGAMAAWKVRRHTNAGEVQAIHPHRNQFDLALQRRAHVHRSVRQPCRHDVIKPKRTTDLSNGCGSQPAYVHCPGGTTTFARHAIAPSQIVTPAKITSIPK